MMHKKLNKHMNFKSMNVLRRINTVRMKECSGDKKNLQPEERTCNKTSLNLPKFMSLLEFNFLAREHE